MQRLVLDTTSDSYGWFPLDSDNVCTKTPTLSPERKLTARSFPMAKLTMHLTLFIFKQSIILNRIRLWLLMCSNTNEATNNAVDCDASPCR
jgi:hypothetical protein